MVYTGSYTSIPLLRSELYGACQVPSCTLGAPSCNKPGFMLGGWCLFTLELLSGSPVHGGRVWEEPCNRKVQSSWPSWPCQHCQSCYVKGREDTLLDQAAHWEYITEAVASGCVWAPGNRTDPGNGTYVGLCSSQGLRFEGVISLVHAHSFLSKCAACYPLIL